MIKRCTQVRLKENATHLRLVASLLILFLPGGLQIAAALDFDECGTESAVAFEDWRGWNKTTPEPYFSGQHANDWVTVYFDDLAKTPDLVSTGKFAVCAKIGKVHFRSAKGIVPRYLMLMAKMPTGFDPDHGDWWYGYYDISVGAGLVEQGAVEGCIKCHKLASGMDYVFAKGQIEKSME
jgi:hypothetical protein